MFRDSQIMKFLMVFLLVTPLSGQDDYSKYLDRLNTKNQKYFEYLEDLGDILYTDSIYNLKTREELIEMCGEPKYNNEYIWRGNPININFVLRRFFGDDTTKRELWLMTWVYENYEFSVYFFPIKGKWLSVMNVFLPDRLQID